MTTKQAKATQRGPSSFCVPRAAVAALIEAKATAYEVCAYLVLARYTDATGCYTSASISAVNKATGANKLKGGPVHRAIERLQQIRVTRSITVEEKYTRFDRRSGRHKQATRTVQRLEDLGAILVERGAWQQQTGEALPDGPTERRQIRYVLPDFGEDHWSRVWFGNNLVSGVGGFAQPLKALKNAGDVAARLLLSLYAANDMETWGGVRPVGTGRGPWRRYEPVADDVTLKTGDRLIRSKPYGVVATIEECISGGSDAAYWHALGALESAGLVYEVVMVLNRNARPSQFSSGEKFGAIPDDAEPLYELDARSAHGFKPEGEEGIGAATANTAGALGHSVTVEGGRFDGTYAAIVPPGFPAMIAGVYRLRFRVANPRNAGVRGTWARIHENNREAFERVQAVRRASNLPPLTSPWASNEARELATVNEFPAMDRLAIH